MPISQATRSVSGDVRRASMAGGSGPTSDEHGDDHEDHGHDDEEIAVDERAQHLPRVGPRCAIGDDLEVVLVRLCPHVPEPPGEPQEEVEGDRRGRTDDDRSDAATCDEHQRHREDHRREQGLHRDRRADAESEPHRSSGGHLVPPPQCQRDREGRERERGAVGGDRARDPQARAGHAHEQRRDEGAGPVGDGATGGVGGADEQQRGEHREQARGVAGAEPEDVGHPHER